MALYCVLDNYFLNTHTDTIYDVTLIYCKDKNKRNLKSMSAIWCLKKMYNCSFFERNDILTVTIDDVGGLSQNKQYCI